MFRTTSGEKKLRQRIKLCAAAALSLALALGLAPSITAHSWYPEECCSGQDCAPADAVYTDTRGRLIVVVGQRRVLVPPGTVARLSPDNRTHVCLVDDPYGEALIRCLFAPALI